MMLSNAQSNAAVRGATGSPVPRIDDGDVHNGNSLELVLGSAQRTYCCTNNRAALQLRLAILMLEAR